MRKLKVLIASMLGAIALVFACVFSGNVNAATEAGDYDLMDLMKSQTVSTSNVTPSAKGIFSFSGPFRYQAAGTTNSNATGVSGVYTNELQIRNSRTNNTPSVLTITLDLSSTETAVLNLKVISASKKNIQIGSADTQSLTDNVVNEISNVELSTGTTEITGSGNVAILELVVTITDSASSAPATSDEETADYSYTDGYHIDIANLSAESTTLTNDELLNFYVPYGTNSTGSVVKYINNSVVNALQTSGSAYGLKFTTTKASVLDIQVGSTSKSNVSIFRVTNVTTSAVLTANEDSTLTTNIAANVAGVYEVTGQNGVAMTYNLPAGEYFMEFISGTTNADSNINRGGRWFKLGLDFVDPVELSAKLQKQVSTDKTAIRFICTLTNFDSRILSQVTSLTYTIKVTGYKAFNKEVTSVYTSVKSGNTEILSEKPNTYYCSYMFTGLLDHEGALVGTNISAFLTIKLKDGTTIKTNSVGYNIVAAE